LLFEPWAESMLGSTAIQKGFSIDLT